MQPAPLHPVEHYVPHRGAMRLIDRLLELGDEHAVAEVVVPADGLFVRAGCVPAWVGLEYMAQTVAAWAGARAQQHGGPARMGFLLGSRRYEALQAEFTSGTRLRIEVRCELIRDDGLGMFDCRILCEGTPVVQASVSVFEPEDGAAFLQQAAQGAAHG